MSEKGDLLVQEYSSCLGEESQVRFNDSEFPGLLPRGFVGQSYQLVKLVDQSESNLSLDIQQALDINSLLINQVKFHLIDLLASITNLSLL